MPNPENIEPHQFKPGESGNPEGRPLGAKSFKTILNELLDLEASEEDLSDAQIKKLFPGGKVSNREILMARLIITAKQSGESKSMERILNRLDGLPKQSIDHKVESVDNKIIIESSPAVPLSKSETDVDAKKE